MHKIKVMQFISGIAIGNPSGGAEYFAIRLARLLDQKIFEPVIYSLWRFDTPEEQIWKDQLENEGIKVFGLYRYPNKLLYADLYKIFIDFWKTVVTFQPDVINSHTERCDFMNVIVHLFHPIHPLAVRTVHIDKQWQTHPIFGKAFNNIIAPISIRKEIAISNEINNMLNKRILSQLFKNKSFVCYNGIDEDIFSLPYTSPGIETIIPGIPREVPLIVVAGRLVEQKGHKYLLDALTRVIQAVPVHLIIIGVGPLEDTLRKQAHNNNLEKYIHFLGSRIDIINLLPSFNLLVSSSLWEGFSTIILEAMAREVPVVATDVSGSRELVVTGETGILVPPKDDAALARAIIEQLYDYGKAKEMAAKAKDLIRQFTIQNTVKQYTELYCQLVKK